MYVSTRILYGSAIYLSVFYMYLVHICMYLYILYILERATNLSAKMYINTCNTWKYEPDTYKINTKIQARYRSDITVHIVCIVCICMYLYVSCMYHDDHVCIIIQNMHFFKMGTSITSGYGHDMEANEFVCI